MEFELADVALALGWRVASEARVTGWSIDSRTMVPGDLFFALRGPNHDGNVYVEEVLRKGAVAAVASEARPGPVLTVPDTLAALQSTAIWALGQWGGGVIGVTGSAGI
jgi:UDP-N-acetylmuramoyl-tripeptide--D-alanyl-D-alanine ligase